MKIIKKYLNEDNLTRILYIFIILQPIFDILSYLYIRNYINIGISTIAKFVSILPSRISSNVFARYIFKTN